MDLAGASAGKRTVVGDEQHGHAAFGLLGEQKIGDLATGFRIQVAGRLIGDQHQRRGRQRPSDRHPLLLSPRQLSRIVVQTLAKPDGGEFLAGYLEGVGNVRKFERHGDVLECRHVGDQVEGLEDDADVAAAEIRQGILRKRVERLARDVDLASIQLFEAGQNHQKRGLAGTGGADDADSLTLVHLKIDLLEDMHGGRCTAEGQIGPLQLDDGFSQRKASYIGFKQKSKPRNGSATFRNQALRFKAIVLHFLVMAAAFVSPAASQQQAVELVGFGDSLMAGYQLAPNESYTAQLEAALKAKGRSVTVTNAGVSGDTTSGGLSRVDWSVPDGTDGVILELGANDALRGVPPEETEDNLDAIITRLKDRGIPVLLAGMIAPPNMGGDYSTRYNEIYPRLAEKHGLPLYPFFLDGVVAVSGTQLEDGMHPNARGVGIMVERSLPAVERFIDEIQSNGN